MENGRITLSWILASELIPLDIHVRLYLEQNIKKSWTQLVYNKIGSVDEFSSLDRGFALRNFIGAL